MLSLRLAGDCGLRNDREKWTRTETTPTDQSAGLNLPYLGVAVLSKIAIPSSACVDRFPVLRAQVIPGVGTNARSSDQPRMHDANAGFPAFNISVALCFRRSGNNTL